MRQFLALAVTAIITRTATSTGRGTSDDAMASQFVANLPAHGRDERVGVKPYFEGLEFQYRLITALLQ